MDCQCLGKNELQRIFWLQVVVFFECRKEEEKILDGYVIVYVHWSCFYCECCYWQEFLNDEIKIATSNNLGAAGAALNAGE